VVSPVDLLDDEVGNDVVVARVAVDRPGFGSSFAISSAAF
jgi:hypothetical protein